MDISLHQGHKQFYIKRIICRIAALFGQKHISEKCNSKEQVRRLFYPDKGSMFEMVYVSSLKKGDIILVDSGDQVPANGEIVEGTAYVDESAITGESVPVIREPTDSKKIVTAGTSIIYGSLVIRIK